MSTHDRAIKMGQAHHAEDRAFFAPVRTAAGISAIYHELAALPRGHYITQKSTQ